MQEPESVHSRKIACWDERPIDCRSLYMRGLQQVVSSKADQRVTEIARIKNNVGLVHKLIKKFPHNMREDLFQEGMIGLMIAARKYDPDVGVRFCTYASYWIMQRVRQHIRKNRLIYFPHHIWNRKVKIDNAKEKLRPNATLKEIATYLNMPLREVKEIFETENTCSLDDNEKHPTTISNNRATPEQQALDSSSECDLINKLFLLDARSRDIIMRHFGISGTEETLSQIAKSYGFSRERIRQIRNKALEFLRRKW